MQQTTKKRRGRLPRFEYVKNVDTFFSSQEMEAYYLKKATQAGYASMRLYLHNILENAMKADETSINAQTN